MNREKQQKSTNKEIKIGAHAVLFAERIKNETENIIEGFAKAGYDGIEIGSRFFGTDDKSRLVYLLDKHNINLCGMHVGIPLSDWQYKNNEAIAKITTVAKFVADMPYKNVIMSGGVSEGADYVIVSKKINDMVLRCCEIGVTLYYHNHSREFVNNMEIFLALYQYAPELCFAMDLLWAYKAGCDPIELIKKYGARIPYVHLRDATQNIDNEFVDLGKGVIDYASLTMALKEYMNGNNWAIIEYERGEQSILRYEKAKRFLENYL